MIKIYPKVSYVGNKRNLTDWILSNIPADVKTVTDAFTGGSSVSYALKQQGYQIISNDILYSSYALSKAIVENQSEVLDKGIISKIKGYQVNSTQINKYKWLANNLYFPEEIKELATIIEYAKHEMQGYQYYLLLSLIRRAMIRKLPYSRMNLNWKNIVKLRDEDYSYKKYKRRRAYHNKSFLYHIENELANYNQAVFKGSKPSQSTNLDVIELLKQNPTGDLLYLDPPYPGTMNNYDSFYGAFDKLFRQQQVHINLISSQVFLCNLKQILEQSKQYKYIMINYNQSIKPGVSELEDLLRQYGSLRVLNKHYVYQSSGKVNKNKNVEKLAILQLK